MKALRSLVVVSVALLIAAWIAGNSTAGRKDAASAAPNRAQSQGSLDDLQRGQPPVTPANSPLKEIYFDFDSFTLRADAREALKGDAGWLMRNAGVRVTVEGHCDERGTTEYNLALGAKRAQAARDYLMSLGLPADRIFTTSFGSETPVCRDHNDECWQKNRRDRLVVQSSRAGA
jgi:peptidoglycan-associated lipoprotein